MMISASKNVFNASFLGRLYKLQPCINKQISELQICDHCRFVNESNYQFCTNCGFPLYYNKHQKLLFNIRQRQRSTILKKSEEAIYAARTTLYVLAAVCLTGIGFFFSSLPQKNGLTLVFITASLLYAGLAKWSNKKPFTAFMVSFIIAITFSVIFIFGSLAEAFTTAKGLYQVIVTFIVLYFLLKGVQGAYRAGLIEEETQIL